MADEKLTTIQIDVETRDRLRKLAEANERSMVGQLRWLVNQQYEKLVPAMVLKDTSLLPAVDDVA